MRGLLRVFILLTTFYGCIQTAEPALVLGDSGVLLAWLKGVAILILRKPALQAPKDYQAKKRPGPPWFFYPEKPGMLG
jgi:AGCS family alanine or glycine:cation symporter